MTIIEKIEDINKMAAEERARYIDEYSWEYADNNGGLDMIENDRKTDISNALYWALERGEISEEEYDKLYILNV